MCVCEDAQVAKSVPSGLTLNYSAEERVKTIFSSLLVVKCWVVGY